jgi:putative tricarboxylic transport membrane protein
MALLDLTRRAGPFAIVLGAGLWLWTVADDFAVNTRLDRAGPDMWPKIVLGLMIGAAIWGIAEAFFKSRPDDDASILIANASRSAGHEEDARQDLSEATDGGGERHPRYAIAGIVAMLAYVVIIPHLGFLVATFLLLLAIMLAAGYTRLMTAIVISLIGALTFFVVFQRLVYVSLPHGEGPFKELTLALMALIGVR